MKIAAFVVDKQASKIDEMLASGKISNSSWQRYLRSIPLMRNLQASPELTALNRNLGNMNNIIPEQAAISLEGGRSQADKLLSRNPYYKNPAALNYGNMNSIDRYIHPKNLIRSFARESTMLVPNQRTGWLAPLEYRRLFMPSRDSRIPTLVDDSQYSRSSAGSGRTWGNLGIEPFTGQPLSAAYSPKDNTIINAKPGNPVFRHELGHWASYNSQVTDPSKYDTRMRSVLLKMHGADPESFNKFRVLASNYEQSRKGQSILPEISGHYLGARSGIGGEKLRNATQKGWSSDWANKIRTKYNDPAAASVVEHLQRNYNVPYGAGNRIGREPMPMFNGAVSEGSVHGSQPLTGQNQLPFNPGLLSRTGQFVSKGLQGINESGIGKAVGRASNFIDQAATKYAPTLTNLAAKGGKLTNPVSYAATEAVGPASAALGGMYGAGPGIKNKLQAGGQAWNAAAPNTLTGQIAGGIGNMTAGRNFWENGVQGQDASGAAFRRRRLQQPLAPKIGSFMKKKSQDYGMMYQPHMQNKTLEDLYFAIRTDMSLADWEKIQLLQQIKGLVGYSNDQTPISVLMYKGLGGVLGALIGKYFGMGPVGQLVSAAAGYGIGKAINNHLNQPPELNGWKVLH